MTTGGMLLLGGATAAAILLTTGRAIGFKNMIKYSVAIDVIATVGVGAMFFGTMGGMLIAVLTGLFIALFFTIVKFIVARVDALPTKSRKRFTVEIDGCITEMWNDDPDFGKVTHVGACVS